MLADVCANTWAQHMSEKTSAIERRNTRRMNGRVFPLKQALLWTQLVSGIILTLTIAGHADVLQIHGSVYDQSGKPLAGVRVQLDGPIHRSATTAPDGAFLFSDTPQGRYTLTFTKAGYARAVRRNVIGSVIARERLPFNSTPASLKVFPREAYRDQGQAALSSVLNQTPGGTVAFPSQQNAAQPLGPYAGTIRGGLPWESAMLVDGNSIALPSTGSFNLAYVPSFLLQEVEIVKGYGTAESAVNGAIDGALNLRTADPAAARKALLEVEADSHGGQFSDLAYGGTAPGGRFAFATMFAVDGNPGPAPTIVAAQAALQRAELLKARYDFSSAVSGTLTYAGSQGVLGNAIVRGFTLPSGFGTFANSADSEESHRFGLYSLELHADAGSDHVSAHAYTMQLQRTGSFDAISFPAIGSGLSTLDNVFGISLQDDHQIGADLFQLQIVHREGRPQASACAFFSGCITFISDGARNDETTLRGAVIAHPTKAMDLQLSAAGLWLRERYSRDGGATFDERNTLAPVVHAGAAFHIKPNLTARVSAGTGVAAPPAAVLNTNPVLLLQTPVGLMPREVSQTSAPNIDAETSFGYDAGVEYRLHGDTTTLSGDVYRTLTHGSFMDANAAGPVWQYAWMNAPPMTHEGAEISLQQFKRAGLGFITQLAFTRTYADAAPPYFGDTANLAVIPGVNLNGGSPFVQGADDVAPLRIPYVQGYAEISYKWPRGSRASIGAQYWGANNAYTRPAFAQLNANLELSLGNFSKFQISVQNLTNVYGDGLPVAFGGIGISLVNGTIAGVSAGVAGPRTVRFMFRQSIGGSLFER